MALARKEQPQAIIMMGPFVDINNTEVINGDIYFQNPDQSRVYLTHEDLFKDLLSTIQKELNGIKTKIILVPSHRDIHHFEPLPQAPFYQSFLPTSQYPQFMSVPNPSLIQLNEIKIGIINAEIIKEMCTGMLPKNMEPPKIDLSLKSLLEQRIFYPLYPPQPETPIEYEQI